MVSIHKILEDPTRAAILAQISRHSGAISAKRIAKNVGFPLSTVYNHLNYLEKHGFISATEIQVRNLSKKVWRRVDPGIEVDGSRVINKKFNLTFSKDPKIIASYVKYLNALLLENLVELQRIDSEVFAKYQESSVAPVWVKLYGLTQDDYEFALTKLGELRRELHERALKNGEVEYRRTEFREEESYLLFLLAFPNLKNHLKAE
ncbi:MAG: winged helix-turn-helix domain-containing protein [Candidatus Hodarchaeales archaeon]|jgi:DNA-binding transcriptional ArsR family regulator